MGVCGRAKLELLGLRTKADFEEESSQSYSSPKVVVSSPSLEVVKLKLGDSGGNIDKGGNPGTGRALGLRGPSCPEMLRGST